MYNSIEEALLSFIHIYIFDNNIFLTSTLSILISILFLWNAFLLIYCLPKVYPI